ncbi:unnamed protein product [Bursaphelenchus okinawaensis]|uniref:Transporter n=1 Tax=Bursaphelenchus okinawaensis TaxID=465554 RepID=A0A811KPZ8_9BILA|nr:unnamed protein product [Bursaphelenchus okinawaensis]CAG9108550.1 unnamed protein product [Bursaphelenchus okinawaensis]
MSYLNGKQVNPPFLQEEEFVDDGDIEYPFEDVGGSGDENRIRGNWSSHMDYYLSVFGFTFALGNLWRFPNQCHLHGGLAYLIPYIVLFFISAIPMLFMELSLGQFVSLGPTAVWKVAPMFKGIGIAMVFICSVTAVYFQLITSWSLFNSSNVEQTNFPKNHVIPSLEYFHTEVLQISDGISDFRTDYFNWRLTICLLVSWSAIFLCSFKGIKTSGKVVYITVVLPYIILFVLTLRFLTLPGSLEGLWHFFYPDFNVLLDLKVWGDAAIQVFYSLSSCTGGLILLSSYSRFHNNVFRDVWLVGFVDLITSVLVSALVFSAIGFVCHEMDMYLDEFKLQNGVQLVFVFFAEALSKLPVAPLYALLFFTMVALIVFNTELFLVETVVSSVSDEYPERMRKNHRHVMTFTICVFFLLGVPLCSGAGLYWIVLLEQFVATWSLIGIAFFEVTVICWVYGSDNFLDNIRWMTHFYPPVYIMWKIIWKFVCPLVFLSILTCIWLEYKPISYNGIIFPYWATILGWVISAVPVIIIIITGIIMICRTEGSFTERWQTLLCPDDDWGPALAVHRSEYYPLQIPEARRLMSSQRFTNNEVYTPSIKPCYDESADLLVRRRNDKTKSQSRYASPERETVI